MIFKDGNDKGILRERVSTKISWWGSNPKPFKFALKRKSSQGVGQFWYTGILKGWGCVQNNAYGWNIPAVYRTANDLPTLSCLFLQASFFCVLKQICKKWLGCIFRNLQMLWKSEPCRSPGLFPPRTYTCIENVGNNIQSIVPKTLIANVAWMLIPVFPLTALFIEPPPPTTWRFISSTQTSTWREHVNFSCSPNLTSHVFFSVSHFLRYSIGQILTCECLL